MSKRKKLKRHTKAEIEEIHDRALARRLFLAEERVYAKMHRKDWDDWLPENGDTDGKERNKRGYCRVAAFVRRRFVARKDVAEFADLVVRVIDRLDKLLALKPTPETGKQLADTINVLDMARQRLSHFTLGIPFPKKTKTPDKPE